MKLVQRGNRQLRVADECLEDMLRAGYVEVDDKTGKPVDTLSAMPDDSGSKRKSQFTKA